VGELAGDGEEKARKMAGRLQKWRHFTIEIHRLNDSNVFSTAVSHNS
jgi:hypothetical protein